MVVLFLLVPLGVLIEIVGVELIEDVLFAQSHGSIGFQALEDPLQIGN